MSYLSLGRTDPRMVQLVLEKREELLRPAALALLCWIPARATPRHDYCKWVPGLSLIPQIQPLSALLWAAAGMRVAELLNLNALG